MADLDFLTELERVLDDRLEHLDDASYTARLAARGTPKVAQKVGEEAVELALAAVTESDERVCAEAADLVYHLSLLLRLRGLRLADVAAELERRHRSRASGR